MGLIDDFISSNDIFERTKKVIKELYLNDNIPWVIGFSGGKDSTTVVQLVVESLLELQGEGINIDKKVYVISSDTMVETPLIISSISIALKKIENFADSNKLPIVTEMVRPAINNTFWVNLIGKGYPVPNQSFRWCTDRMKIAPSNKFITEKVSEFGEAIVLLGVREGESNSRDRVIQSHTIEGKQLMKHQTLSNAFTFAPIRDFDVDDVWNYLLNNKSPWGGDNEELYKLYSDSTVGECPLVIDSETKEKSGSCGNSRFGCWVCTVVTEDKALTGFVENGETWLAPLLKYRNWLTKNRDNRSMRMKRRSSGGIYTVNIKEVKKSDGDYLIIPKKSGREKVEIKIEVNKNFLTGSDGTVYDLVSEETISEYIAKNNIDLDQGEMREFIVKSEDRYKQLGLGPYTFEARYLMLSKLLTLQQSILNSGREVELITKEELKEIRRQWYKKGIVEDRVCQIYEDVFGQALDCEINDFDLISPKNHKLVSEFCDLNGIKFKPLFDLLEAENRNKGKKIKENMQDIIHTILTKDYLHY